MDNDEIKEKWHVGKGNAGWDRQVLAHFKSEESFQGWVNSLIDGAIDEAFKKRFQYEYKEEPYARGILQDADEIAQRVEHETREKVEKACVELLKEARAETRQKCIEELERYKKEAQRNLEYDENKGIIEVYLDDAISAIKSKESEKPDSHASEGDITMV